MWVVKPLRGEWQVLQAPELSAETRFSSKIKSPSFALASVIGLSAGVKRLNHHRIFQDSDVPFFGKAVHDLR